MTTPFSPAPRTPEPAERARSIVSRRGPVTVGISADSSVTPAELPSPVRHVHTDGTINALIDADHPLATAVRAAPCGAAAALVELPDVAPVQLREPFRGLLWVSGLLSVLGAAQARDRALDIAEREADGALLDVGHGSVLLSLHPAIIVLSDTTGTHLIRSEEFTAATPDPFSTWESAWLRHLDNDHPDVVALLARHIPAQLRRGRLRPLALDRFGLRLRVEDDDGDHDVRLAFHRPVRTQHEVASEVRRLAGCPFVRGGRSVTLPRGNADSHHRQGADD